MAFLWHKAISQLLFDLTRPEQNRRHFLATWVDRRSKREATYSTNMNSVCDKADQEPSEFLTLFDVDLDTTIPLLIFTFLKIIDKIYP
jgi:hypothetical protein